MKGKATARRVQVKKRWGECTDPRSEERSSHTGEGQVKRVQVKKRREERNDPLSEEANSRRRCKKNAK